MKRSQSPKVTYHVRLRLYQRPEQANLDRPMSVLPGPGLGVRATGTTVTGYGAVFAGGRQCFTIICGDGCTTLRIH